MHRQVIEAGEVHAELWKDLNIFKRVVAGPEDVTIGEHPVLGFCIVSDDSFQIGFEWCAERSFDLLLKPLS